tara:strand:+ start:237 stop:752 length:516 start_codon:yes stop_codon:yes gene_type:complete
MRLLFLISTIFFFFSFNTLSQANSKIVFVDLNYILTKSTNGKKILDQLNIINNNNLEIIKKDKDILNKEKNEIENLKNILSIEEYNKKKILFEKKVRNFNDKKSKLLNELEKTKENELNIFFDNLNGILKKYMKENSINVVLDKKNIIMANVEIDVSEDILKLVNKYDQTQ